MKELVPSLLTLLKDRRNTAKAFRDKWVGGRGKDWGKVEGGNTRIANKVKGVHAGEVNGDTADLGPSQSGNQARHGGSETLI
jgi:hypothetical protein